ncbi:hypothetical protein [Curtobacterium sp. Leaf261]|uniref:hypothetical protein n=1 Tax=Curtobacterium sp. Leaf261 TaxID=1736311 RepID=UPI0006FEFD55|nr:hypothetical protein [Curtobacterium sp. Leaf261]KQO61354.1 hypothetical protein ASF23_12815 [Curtobacterium sp. Leaf261]
MRGKLLFITGLGLGFVLGARAGRGSYEKLKTRAQDVWTDPNVQKGIHEAEEFVKDKAPVVGNKIKDAAATATEAVRDRVSAAGHDDAADKVVAAGSKAADAVDKATDAAKSGAESAKKAADDAADSGSGS